MVTLAFVSLALACGMSIVAWKLLRDRHDRSAARAEALHALAFAAVQARDERAEAPRYGLLDDPDGAFDTEPDPSPVGVRLEGFDHPADLRLRPEPRARAASRRAVDSTPELFDAPVPTTSSSAHRWLAVAAVALVIAAGVATMYALRSPEIVAAVAASRQSGPQPLELISLQHRLDGNGGFQVTGLVLNPSSGAALRDVVAVVYLFDEHGNYFTSGRAILNLGQVAPGDEAPFVVTFPNAPGVSRYRVGFRFDKGGVVAHVDHRAPSSPNGAAAEAPDVPATTSMPRRSEG